MGRFDALTTLDTKPEPPAPLPEKREVVKTTKQPANQFASKQARKHTALSVNQQASNPANVETNNQTSLQASRNASKHASTPAIKPDIIELIRKIVKTPAKEEVLYVRVTKEEKDQLGDIEYTYHNQQGIDTSANELGRIAINFLIADYQANGEQSILAKVLAALNA
jgi:hypothetical protein